MKINTIFGTLHTDERIHVMKRTKIEINKQMNGLRYLIILFCQPSTLSHQGGPIPATMAAWWLWVQQGLVAKGRALDHISKGKKHSCFAVIMFR